MKKIVLLLFWFALISLCSSQVYANKFTVLAGLGQPLFFNGGNVAVEYKTESFVFEYSHGWDLDYNASGDRFLTEEEANQELKIFQPYTTGFGIGVLFTENLDLRLEFKEHQYRVTPPNDDQFEYTTTSIGFGIFYSYFFDGSDGWQLNSSIRYWPNVSSSLKDNEHIFLNDKGEEQTHKAHDLGLFPNFSIAYTF